MVTSYIYWLYPKTILNTLSFSRFIVFYSPNETAIRADALNNYGGWLLLNTIILDASIMKFQLIVELASCCRMKSMAVKRWVISNFQRISPNVLFQEINKNCLHIDGLNQLSAQARVSVLYLFHIFAVIHNKWVLINNCKTIIVN